MKIRTAPDSILCVEKEETHGWYAHIQPWIWLVWLVWLIGPAFFSLRSFPHWVLATSLSLPVFLATYVLAHTCPRRQILWYAIAVAVIAVVVTPFNPFAQTYLIYACAIAADWSSPRKSSALVLGLLAAYSLEWFYLGFPGVSLVNAWIFCPIITALIVTARIQRQHRAELRLSHDEVRRLAASAERERIGRDLHDLLGHTLSLVTLKSELAGRLIERNPQAARREIAEVERVAREALAQVRSAVSGIRAAALASELASARLLLETAGVRVEYWCDPQALPTEVETCLALVLREAVTNVQRHAHANGVEITVIAGVERVVMRIRDDGRGGVLEHGNGLTGMRERIVACGGDLAIESARGSGTNIEVSLPLPPASKTRIETTSSSQEPAVATLMPIGRRAGSHA